MFLLEFKDWNVLFLLTLIVLDFSDQDRMVLVTRLTDTLVVSLVVIPVQFHLLSLHLLVIWEHVVFVSRRTQNTERSQVLDMNDTEHKIIFITFCKTVFYLHVERKRIFFWTHFYIFLLQGFGSNNKDMWKKKQYIIVFSTKKYLTFHSKFIPFF